jgi:hypothetical protein
MRVLIFTAVLLAGCYEPHPDACRYRCGPGDMCPAGLACHDGFCGAPGACLAVEDAPIDLAIDTPIDAVPCTGTTACWLPGGTAAQAACNDGPAAGTCVPDDFVYCRCNAAVGNSLFVETISGNSRRVLVVHQAGLLNVALSIDGICYGTTGVPCNLDAGACQGSLAGVHVFSPISVAPGSHAVTVYSGDVGAPCFTNDGGMVLFTTTVAL